MSGFYALYHRNSFPVDINTLGNMQKSMVHRARDGSGLWYKNNIGLGHCMFRTTPESRSEKLPYRDNETDLVITADARIDDRIHLLKQLGENLFSQEDLSDSYLILLAYRKWGIGCVQHLLGDFAFIIWDQKQQLFYCARDHLGVKPFYYHISEQNFAAASEVNAVLQAPQVPKTLNEGRIADYLVPQLEGIDQVSTFYASIMRLPPAHYMVVSKNKMLISRYWHADSGYETRFQSDFEYVERFREILTLSIQDRLRCHEQPVVMLSGGIDSSSIAACAQGHKLGQPGQEIPVYSGVSLTAPDCVESGFIRRVIQHLSVKHFIVSSEDIAKHGNQLQTVLQALPEPFDAMTIIILIYLIAQQNGHRIILDGVEGDMVHSLPVSYPAHLLRKGHPIQAISEILGLYNNYYQKQYSLIHIIHDTIRHTVMPNVLRRAKRRLMGSLSKSNPIHGTIINTQFADKVHIVERLNQLHDQGCEGLYPTLRQQHAHTATHPYLVTALERYDRVAAYCGVEARHPLLDKRLVEYSISLPWNQIVRRGWSKYILRRACESLLPSDIVWRCGWEHLGVSFTSAFIHNRLSNMKESIQKSKSILKRYINHQYLNKISEMNDCVAGSEEEFVMWQIYLLAIWLSSRA